jgi:hypothetical protein
LGFNLKLGVVVVRSPRFEPGSSAWQASKEIDWEGFKKYIDDKKYRGSYGTGLFNYAMQYKDCLFNGDLSRVRDLSDGMRPNILKALAALAKYSGCYDSFKRLVKDYDLGWGGRSADDIFIDRLTHVQNPDEIWTRIKTVKGVRPDLTELLDLMAITGMRFVEGITSYHLIGELAADEKLPVCIVDKQYKGGYYNRDLSALEHFRFKSTFIRSSKKAFVSFVPAKIVEAISEGPEIATGDAVQKLVQKKGLQLRFGDIREAHATLMTKYLKPPEIDFLHGRVTASVFMQHYFNPALIGDLKYRVFQGIQEIQQKIKL